MRTTVNLDDDLVEVARSIAVSEGRSLGGVLSDLIRRGLSPVPGNFEDEDGFPVFAVAPGTAVITPDMVRSALDEP